MKPSRAPFDALRTGGLHAVVDALAEANTTDPIIRDRARRVLANASCSPLANAIDAYTSGTPVPQAQSAEAVREWSAVFNLLAAATAEAAALIAKTSGVTAFRQALSGRVAMRSFEDEPKGRQPASGVS